MILNDGACNLADTVLAHTRCLVNISVSFPGPLPHRCMPCPPSTWPFTQFSVVPSQLFEPLQNPLRCFGISSNVGSVRSALGASCAPALIVAVGCSQMSQSKCPPPCL